MFAADRSRRLGKVVWNPAAWDDHSGTRSLSHFFECCKFGEDSDVVSDQDFRTGWLSDVTGNRTQIQTAEAEIQKWIRQEVGAV